MQQEIILNDNQLCILKIINHVYLNCEKGCNSIKLTADISDLQFLEENGLIFQTSKGYFPSTIGQNYLK